MAITSPIRIDCKVFRGCCLMKEVMDWWSSLQILNKRGQLLLLSSEQFKLTSFLYFPLLCLPMSTTLLIGAVIWIQKNCENDLIAIRRCINVTKVSNFSFEIMLKSIEDYNLVYCCCLSHDSRMFQIISLIRSLSDMRWTIPFKYWESSFNFHWSVKSTSIIVNPLCSFYQIFQNNYTININLTRTFLSLLLQLVLESGSRTGEPGIY